MSSAVRTGVKAARCHPIVDARRLRVWKASSVPNSSRPVLYWSVPVLVKSSSRDSAASRMSRDRRVHDNWALLRAVEEAERTNSPLGVMFNLVESFLGGCARQFGFMLRGVHEAANELERLDIPFFLFQGSPIDNIPQMASRCKARLVVMDYSPLRIATTWKNGVMEKLTECGLEEVDAHNVVPVWVASDKREYAAYTIRPKINKHLADFLTNYPPMKPLSTTPWPADCQPDAIDWEGLLETVLSRGADVPEVDWIVPGEMAGRDALEAFLRRNRLGRYATHRNNPVQPDAQSGLSPYFHFGFLSPQRAAFEARKQRNQLKESVDQFLEELIIRRELSDNFCHYEPNYDKIDAAAGWARASLQQHLSDQREFIYTKDQFETAQTHEDLWNACQKELIYAGKLHGYMRMYWAKKILDWTENPEDALEISIYLNDKYSLDGRDPNGYVGCQWSIAGIHDRAFKERRVSGKIRPMTYSGCKRKFDIDAYISRIADLERKAKARG